MGAVAALAAALVVWGCDQRPKPPAPPTPECVPVDLSCKSACDGRGMVTLAELAAEPVEEPAVPVALMITVPWAGIHPDRGALQTWVAEVLPRVREAYAQCGVGVSLVRAELVAVPPSLWRVTANGPKSWAGLAPLGMDPEAFNHALGERLTPEVATLFTYARRGLPARTLTVVAVDEVHYFAAQQRTTAGGLSFPPALYYAPEDFPARNGVLLSLTYGRCGTMPKAPPPAVMAHELGHMLLNVAHHEDDWQNLMGRVSGPKLREDQCAAIRENLRTLYGEDPIRDPSPPTR